MVAVSGDDRFLQERVAGVECWIHPELLCVDECEQVSVKGAVMQCVQHKNVLGVFDEFSDYAEIVEPE